MTGMLVLFGCGLLAVLFESLRSPTPRLDLPSERSDDRFLNILALTVLFVLLFVTFGMP